MGSVGSVVVGIAVLAWVIYNQLRPRVIDTRRLRIVGVLGVIGLVQVATTASAHPVSALAAGLLVLGLAVGAGLGVWRAVTVRVWTGPDGRPRQQGGALTAGLWLVGIAAHVGLDLLARAVDPASEPVNASSILLFVAISIGVQAVVTLRRAGALAPGTSYARSR